VFPILARPEDYPDRVLGEAKTKAQAKKLVCKWFEVAPERVAIEKIGLDNLLNTSGVVFWQYCIVKATEKAMSVQDAIALLNLPENFDLLDLKTCYRTAAKATHSDVGGEDAQFIEIKRAYDLLNTMLHKQSGSSERWDAYLLENLQKWEGIFRKQWKAMCDRGLINPAHQYNNANRYGLNYSTCIENFTREYCEPMPGWFLNCVYPPLLGSGISIAETRQRYREHLIAIAPNKTMSEIWARKYFCLEFGESVPWVFYLPPAKEVSDAA
jgi:hypothetical protein